MFSPALSAALFVATLTAPAQDSVARFLDPIHLPVEDGQAVEVEPLKPDHSTRVVFTAESPGQITWPTIHPELDVEGWILPMSEGRYVPVDDEQWIEHLVGRGPMNTTASLSMPWIALDLDGATLTFVFENAFDNEVCFFDDEGRLGVRVTHRFQENWNQHEYAVTVLVGEDSPIAPARLYRDWLRERGELVTMPEKIARLPRAERLLGAVHMYLWGNQTLAREDIPRPHWSDFCRRLISAEAGTVAHDVFHAMSEEAQNAAREITEAEQRLHRVRKDNQFRERK